MAKDTLDSAVKPTEDTREGGRERPKVVTSGFSGSQSRSGSASHAASLLDLRQKVNFLMSAVEAIAGHLGDADLVAEIQSTRRRGYQRGK